MALKRSMLTGMGLTEEQVAAIIEGHDETVKGLKDQIDALKDKADAADALKKERDDLKKQIEDAKGGTDWKAEFDRLKADTEAKESLAKVKAAYKKLLKEAKVDDDVLDTVMDATSFDGMKLDKDGSLKDADKLTEGINSRWGKFVVTEGTKAPPTKTPPAGGKVGKTKDEIMAIKDTKERQDAIAENHELFGF